MGICMGICTNDDLDPLYGTILMRNLSIYLFNKDKKYISS